MLLPSYSLYSTAGDQRTTDKVASRILRIDRVHGATQCSGSCAGQSCWEIAKACWVGVCSKLYGKTAKLCVTTWTTSMGRTNVDVSTGADECSHWNGFRGNLHIHVTIRILGYSGSLQHTSFNPCRGWKISLHLGMVMGDRRKLWKPWRTLMQLLLVGDQPGQPQQVSHPHLGPLLKQTPQD